MRCQNHEDVSVAPGGREHAGASSVPALRRSPTGPVTVVIGKMVPCAWSVDCETLFDYSSIARWAGDDISCLFTKEL